MVLSDLSQVPGPLWSALLLSHFTRDKQHQREEVKCWSSDSSQGQSGPEACALELFAASVRVHIVGGKGVPSEETVQTKVKRC